MANHGKYIDRTPVICPAGIKGDHNESVADCLRSYSLVDQIDAVKHEQGVVDKEPTYPEPKRRAVNSRHPGLFCESRPSFCATITRRYEQLLQDLRETPYRSYWDMQVGKTRDPTGGLPAGMHPEVTTFGKPYVREYGVKELLNPSKTVIEVLWDSQEGHEMYKKTHNDYNPSEQVDRGYRRPAFDPNRRYGMTTIYDPKGIWVKCACTWHVQSELTFASNIQADVIEKTKYKLGKCLTPNNNKEVVPKGFRFGKPCKKEMCGVRELLRDADIEPCLFLRDYWDWIEHLNQLRNYIKRRQGVFIDLKDLTNMCRYYDKERNGWISLDILYEICKCKHLNFQHDKMNALACLLGILRDGQMDYAAFIKLIDVNQPVPAVMKVNEIPKKNNYFVTTNQAARCDYLFIDNTNLRVAGVPTVRMDLPRSAVPPGRCLADLDHLGDETTAGAIVNPSIYTNYGLSHRDFFLPRQPEYLKKLFETMGYQFPNGNFDKLWMMGVELDKTGLVCVDTFKKLIRDSLPPPTFAQPEQMICH